MHKQATLNKYSLFIARHQGKIFDLRGAQQQWGMCVDAKQWIAAGIVKKQGAKRYLLRSDNPEQDAARVLELLRLNEYATNSKAPLAKPAPAVEPIRETPKTSRAIAQDLLKALLKENADIVANLQYWTKDGGNCIDEMWSSLEMDCSRYGSNLAVISDIQKTFKL